jgi:ribosomal protein S18 acetylase RimI-like enzyme
MESAEFEIRPFDQGHVEWAAELMKRYWGSTQVVSRCQIHDVLGLAGFVALTAGRPVGLANYRLADGDCQLVTLHSEQSGIGIGSALLDAVKEIAQQAACGRLWLITTNDNLLALRFYQRQGFCLVALHRDALVASRKLKPEIPFTGIDGIPLRDEIELELSLGTSTKR